LDNLQINKDNPDMNAVFKEVGNKLNNLPGTNLFIIDDAQGDLNKIKDILPSTGDWKILVSSRRQFDDIPDYEIKFLSKESAFQLFYNYYKEENDDTILEEILSPVEYHTLVTEIFAKHANKSNYSLKKLKSKILESGFDLNTRINTNHAEESIKHILTYMNSVFPLTSLEEKKLNTLRIFALFPSEFIDISDIFELFDVKYEDQDDFILESLTPLVEMGWLAKEQSFYKLHQVIKQLILETFPPDFKCYENYLKTIKDLLSMDQSKDNPIDKFKWVPYGEIIVKLFDVENVLKSVLFNNLALVYKNLGRYQEAAELLEKALKSDIKNFGEGHPSVVVRQSNLAMVYQDLCRYQEATELLEKALKSDIKNFGDGHPSVAVRQSNLALAYKNLGRYQEAAELLEKALKSDIKNFGEGHPTVVVIQSNMAMVYQDLDRYPEAVELLEKALNSNIKNFGEGHPTVAVSQSNLAMVYQDLCRYQEAVNLLESTLELNKKNYELNHPYIAQAQSNLAMVYKDLGRYPEAVELLEKALKSDIKNFGDGHPSVAVSQSNLAMVYKDLGRYQEAKELFIKALKTFEAQLGQNHPTTKIIRNNFDNLNKVMKDKSHT
jgi:tetratricopeptide (TPR) repeat protein